MLPDLFLGDRIKRYFVPLAVVLFVVLALELALSVRLESPTFDEPAHLYAGYLHWVRRDFGVNPEHPPLVKMIASSPLLIDKPKYPEPMDINFRPASSLGGRAMVTAPGSAYLLTHGRTAVSVFVFCLALLVLLAGYEMFGAATGLFALALFVFDPLVLAHGALVDTDVGAACLIFATVYAFYRYVKQPSWSRLAVCGVAAGLALAAKHSAMVILPILALLATAEMIPWGKKDHGTVSAAAQGRTALRLAGSVAAIALLAITILWAFYGFRYAARPNGRQITPPTAAFLEQLNHPREARAIGFAERHHLLPEAYLYGLTDVTRLSRDGRTMYLFGKLYPSGQWFYFPAAFLIKSTLGILLLLMVLPFARDLWRTEKRREVVFLALPAVVFLAAAMSSKVNIGIRHIFPILPLLFVLLAAGAVSLARRSRAWTYAVVFFLALHVASSLKAFPNYLPYSNELFGGPEGTHRVLADSNVGWGGGLKALHAYLEEHQITDCWFAYSAVIDPATFDIPCKQLPTFFSMQSKRGQQQPVPEQIRGPVFISSEEMAGHAWGPGAMNPYYQFSQQRPAHIVAGEILEFDDNYSVPDIAALSHYALANMLLAQRNPEPALEHARTAVALAPNLRFGHEAMAAAYAALHQPEDATREYQTAKHLYATASHEFRGYSAPPQNPLAQSK